MVLAAVILAFTIYYPLVIRGEEAVQERLHGDAFADYCSRVPRFWPRWSLLIEPAQWPFSSKNFRRACGDVVWFVLGWCLLMVIHEMHHLGRLPVWLRLP